MIKFGRKFFFDKVHKKRNYKLPITIISIALVAILVICLIPKIFKEKKQKPELPNIVLKKAVNIEIYNEIPSIDEFVKELENIDINELNITYSDELEIVENLEGCNDEENINDCKKFLAASLGKYKVTISSDKLEKAKTTTLNVVDKTAPILETKEVTIKEGDNYNIQDFVASCSDNSKNDCSYRYVKDDKDESDNVIDYSSFKEAGEYKIKLYAIDNSKNKSEIKETKLVITKKVDKPVNNCDYGNLEYSKSYIIATKIDNNKCAISPKKAESLGYKPGISHNKKLAKEIQAAYLQKTIDNMNLEGELIYDITYGPVYNTSNKGVVGYYLLSEAHQIINGKKTTIARYFIDENGNRVWKINTLNLK